MKDDEPQIVADARDRMEKAARDRSLAVEDIRMVRNRCFSRLRALRIKQENKL